MWKILDVVTGKYLLHWPLPADQEPKEEPLPLKFPCEWGLLFSSKEGAIEFINANFDKDYVNRFEAIEFIPK